MADHTVLCTYRVKAGSEEEFHKLLTRHATVLRSLDAVTDKPNVVYRSVDEPPVLVEIFEWAGDGYLRARAEPAVMEIWTEMERHCEVRDGRPSMEFPHFQAVDLP